MTTVKQTVRDLCTLRDDRFDIPGDRHLWETIVADMMNNGGDHLPTKHWVLLDEESNYNAATADEDQLAIYLQDAYWQRFDNLTKMLDPIIGCNGMVSANKADYEKYQTFLRFLNWAPDPVPEYIQLLDSPGLLPLKVTDLGSIMDLALINYVLPHKGAFHQIYVLEIGGGFGRLAEAFYNTLEGRVKYVLIDAVPGSLMYSYLYLKRHLPSAKIGYYYNGDKQFTDDFDIYISPSWHFPGKSKVQFDLAINVESFQEMNEQHVEHYLGLIDAHLKIEGIAYLSNARDYVNQAKAAYPDNWRCLFRQNTPRSWTVDHPTELFCKSDASSIRVNGLHDAAYRFSVRDRELLKSAVYRLAEAKAFMDSAYGSLNGLKKEIAEKVLGWPG